MSRLFIALKLPDLILDEIIQIRKSIYRSGEIRKWEAKEKLHITIKFLGETNKRKEILSLIESVLIDKVEFECQLNKFGMFYRNEIPSILWVSIKENSKLFELSNVIDDSMSTLGFEKEKRKFKPHITVLRNKSKNDLNLLEKFKGYDLSNLKFTAKHIHLLESKLLPTGSVYKSIGKYELNKLEE